MKNISIKTKNNNAFIIAIFVFIISGFLLQAINLSSNVPFHDWDEAIYAQVAKEFARRPSTLLTYNGSPWFEKPPLPSMLYAASWMFPAKYEFSARFVSLLFSITSLYVIYQIMTMLKISKSARLIAVFATIASSMYRDRTMIVNVDIMLTAGWLIYLLGNTKNNLSLRMIGTTVGTLSKSLLGFFPLFVEIFVDIIFGKLSKRKIFDYFILFTTGFAWHIYMIVAYGQPFIKSHFIEHLISRVTKPIELHFGDKWFYVIKLWGETNLFLVLAVLGFLLIAFQIFKKLKFSKTLPKITSQYLTLTLLPLAYITLLTFSRSKLHWYTTPLIPFAGIWAAIFFDQLLQTRVLLIKKILPFAYIAITTYSLFIFAKSVYSSQQDSYKPNDKTIIGICVGKYATNNDKITYFVPPQERKDAQVIEAANLQIGSSFIYGSAPAFLYYADRPVNFVFKESDYKSSLKNTNITVLSKSDLKNHEILTSTGQWLNAEKKGFYPLCTTDTLVAYRRSF